jgi:Ca-activated chloride channel family protein
MNLPHHHLLAHPWLLWSLAALPLLAVLAVWGHYRKRRALGRFGSLLLVEVHLSGRRRPRLRGLGLVFALALLGVGAAGPQWGRDWDQSAAPGRDLVVVLDCSHSMFAEAPSRLERARRALLDLADAVEKRGGHRLALVLCAGQARLACPLTHDYDHFRSKVEEIDLAAPDPDLEPAGNERSGTRLGLGLYQAVLAFGPSGTQGARDILLLSDGDDPARDGEWGYGAAEAAARGIPVHVVGIGDPDTASPIRLGGVPQIHEGRPVLTKLEEAPLRDIAERTHGLYTSARTRALPLGDLYLDTIRALPVREESDDALPVYRQHYRWFLGPAFALLATNLLFGDRVRRRKRSQEQ